MLWCHGGGFTGGSGGNVRYDGAMLAKKHGVVLVTVNHRLNAFGFLYLAKLGGEKYADSGNVGMLDIVAALNWVKDNIAEFGGDPGNVTIFGQSGGGSKVTTAMAMPQAVGRFHRVIAESGVALKAITPDEGTEIATKIMTQLGLQPNQVDQLQQIPFQQIIAALGPMGPAGRFGPVLDGRSLVLRQWRLRSGGAVSFGQGADDPGFDLDRDHLPQHHAARSHRRRHFARRLKRGLAGWTMRKPKN